MTEAVKPDPARCTRSAAPRLIAAVALLIVGTAVHDDQRVAAACGDRDCTAVGHGGDRHEDSDGVAAGGLAGRVAELPVSVGPTAEDRPVGLPGAGSEGGGK